ncbi:MAG: Glutathione transport system permease protein GsiC [Anaerolineales bacterium]|nr:Glutathione transport system permease protein GsiC [Anaerolineales bacterium]
MIPALLLVSMAVFMIIHLIPGDPAKNIAGPNATDEQLAALTRRFGLDKPLPVQYVTWLGNALRGDMGYSFINKYPVNTLIAQRVPATIELAFSAAIVAVLISFPLGILSALHPGSIFDFVTTLFSALSFGVPAFWVGIMLILLFGLQLRLLPPSGRPKFGEQPVQHLKSLIMPACTLGIALAAKLTRYLRSSMLDVLDQDYVRTARAKGLRERVVTLRHVLRNTLIPVITILGLQTGDLLSGAIIVESVFAWPGVGRLTLQAIGWRDYSLLQADVLYIVLAFMLINLLTDLVYGLVDPRIRYA